ncbi:TetR/AcrR family transcriptional regulator [Nocardia sp. NPDC127606]|uniref:TetR/AcrR family transcriptional regulator n=1 Tax=Nocardia sp. NPDC127606 TaxID=3345406 RepID=UPI003633E169
MTTVNPRIRTPRAEVRERVLAAALSEFAGKGFVGTTIDAIADVAGFTKGAVYSNFGSKDDLFFALLDQQISRRIEAVTALADAAATRPTITAIGDLLMQGMLDNRDWQLLFTEYWLRALRDESVRERFVQHRRTVRAAIAAAVQRLDLGTEVDPATTAVLVLALNSGLSIEEFTEPGVVPPDLFGAVLQAVTAQR